jgi:hypothetical protein
MAPPGAGWPFASSSAGRGVTATPVPRMAAVPDLRSAQIIGLRTWQQRIQTGKPRQQRRESADAPHRQRRLCHPPSAPGPWDALSFCRPCRCLSCCWSLHRICDRACSPVMHITPVRSYPSTFTSEWVGGVPSQVARNVDARSHFVQTCHVKGAEPRLLRPHAHTQGDRQTRPEPRLRMSDADTKG